MREDYRYYDNPGYGIDNKRWDHGRNHYSHSRYDISPEYLDKRQKQRELKKLPDIWERSPSPPRKEQNIGKRDKRKIDIEQPPKKKQRKSKKHKKQKDFVGPTLSIDSDNENYTEEHIWVEKPSKKEDNDNEQREFVGPEPLPETFGDASYGTQLLPGEGAAMAAYVQQNKRIPRRGEVGLTAEQIEDFENMGYVMSGSRHLRMNAVRLRKENEVYSVEQKIALAKQNYEERAKKENEIIASFRDTLAKKKEEYKLN